MDLIAIIFGIFGPGISILALIVSYRQLRMQRLQIKSEIASKYFVRFNADPCLKQMTTFIEMNKEYKIDGKIKTPDCHDATVFLRYFEELELLIRSNSINENIVYFFILTFLINKETGGMRLITIAIDGLYIVLFIIV